MLAGCNCGRALAPIGFRRCMNAFVGSLPASVCNAIHGKAHRTSQHGRPNHCLTSLSAFAGSPKRILLCVMHRDLARIASIDSQRKWMRLPPTGSDGALRCPDIGARVPILMFSSTFIAALSPLDFFFVESPFLNERSHARDVALDIEHLRRKINIVPSGFDGSWNQACAGKK